MKKTFKYFLYLSMMLLIIIASYFAIAYIFTFFPKNCNEKIVKNKTVYLLYSPIHTDIVFNIQEINLSNFPEFKEKKDGFLAFGWGDKETYLNTPNINDIKISTSLKALFINTPSLMHVSYLPNILRYKSIKPIALSDQQENYLKNSILQSFDFQKNVYQGYAKEDFFYTAKGHYNLINTCNTWTGDKLRESNLSMAYWTPFVWSIITP